ncbi:MAG TPA: GNAT family N-acetyltransferase [Pirellulales bacterium]|nr:GNAT family N-acetyltransferase [Pirellulales bacterium]
MANSLCFHLRLLRRRDVPAMLTIERACFASPWGEADFAAALAPDRAFGLAAECHGDVCGYLIGEREGGRVQVLNLCVGPPARRRGVASLLVQAVAGRLRQQQRLVTIVGERNLPAQLFCRSQGFRAVTILRRYLPGTGDDAYLFEYRPHAAAAPFMPANRVAAYL